MDWQPFEQFTTYDSNQFGTTTKITIRLEPTLPGSCVFNIKGKPRGPWFTVMLFNLLAKYVFTSQLTKSMNAFRQRIEQDLADGIVTFSPSIEVDKAQLTSLTTQALTLKH